MKQKILKSLLLALLSFGWLFNFGAIQQAKAACNYEIKRFDPDGKTSATPSDILQFRISVERSGNLSDCGQVSAWLVMVNGGSIKDLANTALNFQGGMATATLSFDLRNFDRSQLSAANQIQFRAQIRTGIEAIRPKLQESGIWTVNITGDVGTSGSIPMSIYYKPIKTTFNGNENIQVLVHLNTQELNRFAQLNRNVTQLYFQLWVNGKKLSGFDKPITVVSNDQYFDLQVNSVNGFNNGTNTVKVELFQSGTSLKISEVVGTLQVQGLSATPQNPGSPSTTNPGQPGTSNPGNPGTSNPGIPGGSTATPLPNCDANSNDPRCVKNPLQCDNLVGCVLPLVRWFMGLLGVLAVVFVMIGGFQMVTSAGNEDAYSKGKNTVKWAIGGLVVALLSFAMIAIVQNVLDADVPSAAYNTHSIPIVRHSKGV